MSQQFLQDDPTQNSTFNAPHAHPGLQDDPTQNSTFNAPHAHQGLQGDPTKKSTFDAPRKDHDADSQNWNYGKTVR